MGSRHIQGTYLPSQRSLSVRRMNYTITTRQTKTGIAFDLYVRWQGKRYRPLLGYNLTPEDADLRAIAMIAKIQQNEPSPPSTRSTSPTFRDFLPLYWQTMGVKKRFDLARPESVLETHLLPRFSDRRLDSLTAEDGLAYITARSKRRPRPGPFAENGPCSCGSSIWRSTSTSLTRTD